MSLTESSNQLFLPGGATNLQKGPYISVWPLHYKLRELMFCFFVFFIFGEMGFIFCNLLASLE